MIPIPGMGVAGLCAATAPNEAGLRLQRAAPLGHAASHLAGGMLAPFCEAEDAHLRADGKPPKVAIVAIMRKLLETANAIVKANRLRGPKTLAHDGYSGLVLK